MNRNESRYFNTAVKMDKAFLELLEEKDFPYITVKEICAKAEVNRSTFYLHYGTLNDLLLESVEYLNQQFREYMGAKSDTVVDKIHTCSEEELYLVTPEYLKPYLAYIQEHRRLFRTAIQQSKVLDMKNSYTKMFQHVFTPILERYRVPEVDRVYMMTFYVHGIMAIIEAWMQGDCSDDVNHVIEVIQQCVMHH